MTDPFDQFLGAALAPPARDPDAAFVLRVRALCALEARLAAEGRATVHRLLVQGLALAAVAAGLAWLGRSGAVAAFVLESPVLALGATMAGFAVLLATVAASPGGKGRAASA